MAAPTPTARGTPGGIKLRDGFSSKITFATAPTVALWEKTVKPPGMDGGDSVPQTTMHNTVYKTKAPQQLKELTDSEFTAAYDPICYTTLLSLINVLTVITVAFPDGSSLAFFGYLQKFIPGELKMGEQPEAQCTIVATNMDTSVAEQSPVETDVAGT